MVECGELSSGSAGQVWSVVFCFVGNWSGMAGKVGCVVVRWGSVGYGQAGEFR